MKDFDIYSLGMVHASLCTTLSNEEATERMNGEFPTGIGSDWQISDDETFADGKEHPCKCEDSPETHRQILFVC